MSKFIKKERTEKKEMNNIFRRAKTLTFIDIETTGLDFLNCGMLEFAAMKTTTDMKTVISKYTTIINPNYNKNLKIEEGAMRVNGFTEEVYSKGADINKEFAAISNYVFDRETVLVGHNIAFDLSFLVGIAARFMPSVIQMPFCLDTSSMSAHLLINGKIQKNTLPELIKYFEVGSVVSHRALDDVEMTAKVFEKLLSLKEG
jgi:DNA polymerase III alpha subunit (gram-positive type)